MSSPTPKNGVSADHGEVGKAVSEEPSKPRSRKKKAASRIPVKSPGFHLEAAHIKACGAPNATIRIAGVDEAGRGPLAGPVVAAAVVLKNSDPLADLPLLNDSKKLSSDQRETLAVMIRHHARGIGVGVASPDEIDHLNIRQATLLAMTRAIEALPDTPDYALIDGRDLPPHLPCPAEAVIKGDGESASIAAASIIAKTTRDEWMKRLNQEYPGYGWERNSGYPTKEHRQALETLGPTPVHRRSFGPVRKVIEGCS
ncbi:MAG: ribonuclease HII [Magnetococcales bacterium]|nr:ribonuclease HII [Magnetococcales bacterium]